jgi:hypothetical protein
MSKTLLFPTDFTVASLAPVRKAIADHPREQLDIVLVHGIYLSDSITELLFFSRHATIKRLSSPEFEDNCRILQELHADQINSFRTKLFTGLTQSTFDSFVEALRADRIYLPETALKNGRRSMDLSGFIAKCNVGIVRSTAIDQEQPVEKLASGIRFAK